MDTAQSHDPHRTGFDATVDLVNWLTARTDQRRLKWVVDSHVITTSIPGSFLFQFILAPSPLGGHTWCLFSARDASGELFRATPSQSPHASSPLLDSVSALFTAVTKPADFNPLRN